MSWVRDDYHSTRDYAPKLSPPIHENVCLVWNGTWKNGPCLKRGVECRFAHVCAICGDTQHGAFVCNWEICNNFNFGTCDKETCHRAHICTECWKDHPFYDCLKNPQNDASHGVQELSSLLQSFKFSDSPAKHGAPRHHNQSQNYHGQQEHYQHSHDHSEYYDDSQHQSQRYGRPPHDQFQQVTGHDVDYFESLALKEVQEQIYYLLEKGPISKNTFAAEYQKLFKFPLGCRALGFENLGDMLSLMQDVLFFQDQEDCVWVVSCRQQEYQDGPDRIKVPHETSPKRKPQSQKRNSKEKSEKSSPKFDQSSQRNVSDFPNSADNSVKPSTAELDALKQKLDATEEAFDRHRVCQICMDGERDTILLPCGHFLYCSKCAANLDVCACCRKDVATRQKVFT